MVFKSSLSKVEAMIVSIMTTQVTHMVYKIYKIKFRIYIDCKTLVFLKLS